MLFRSLGERLTLHTERMTLWLVDGVLHDAIHGVLFLLGERLTLHTERMTSWLVDGVRHDEIHGVCFPVDEWLNQLYFRSCDHQSRTYRTSRESSVIPAKHREASVQCLPCFRRIQGDSSQAPRSRRPGASNRSRLHRSRRYPHSTQPA